MKCPYCGNDEPDKFAYPDEDEAWATCHSCYGDFEPEEIKYYQAQSEEGESERDDLLLSLSAITQLLDNEIKWCEGQEDSNLAVWFIKGLEQAKYLILELSKIDHQEEEVVTLLIINDSNFDDAVISALPEQIREALDCAQTPDHKSASVWVALLGEVALEECESILSKRGIKYLLAYPREAEIKAHPENYGKPGWMGDYGGIPHGPFDV